MYVNVILAIGVFSIFIKVTKNLLLLTLNSICVNIMQKKMIIVFILEAIFIAGMVAVALTLEHTHPARSMLVGILCVIMNIVMYASPLTVVVSNYDYS